MKPTFFGPGGTRGPHQQQRSATELEVLALLRKLVGPMAASAAGGPWLVVSPHPDDETIGASWLLSRAPALTVVHVTDGAPRDRRLWPRSAPSERPNTREAYARVRALELRRALAVIGVKPWQAHTLGFVDQEVSFSMVELTHALLDIVATVRPRVMVVTPYEGGHPDHDASAYAAHAAVALLRRRGQFAPFLLEMGSYHRAQDALATDRFVEAATASVSCPLSERDQLHKRQMFACYASQTETLAPFDCVCERFRAAPSYDFLSPPHAGALHYESLGWPMRSEVFCALTSCANTVLGLTDL